MKKRKDPLLGRVLDSFLTSTSSADHFSNQSDALVCRRCYRSLVGDFYSATKFSAAALNGANILSGRAERSSTSAGCASGAGRQLVCSYAETVAVVIDLIGNINIRVENLSDVSVCRCGITPILAHSWVE